MIKHIEKLIVGCSRCVQMRKKQRWYGRRYTSAYKLFTCTTIILGNIHCEKNWDISMQCPMYFCYILLHMTNIYLSPLHSMHLTLSQCTYSSYLRKNVVFIKFLNRFFDISSGREEAHLFQSVSI